MGGNFRGAQKFIKDEISKLGGTVPEYYHCASHRLNLAVSSAAGTPQIERALAKVKETIDYFHGSAKRAQILENSIEAHNIKTNATTNIKLNPTRWTERYESLKRFKLLIEVIIDIR